MSDEDPPKPDKTIEDVWAAREVAEAAARERREKRLKRDLPDARDLVEPGYILQAEDFAPSPARPITAFMRFPAKSAARPALFCFVLFLGFSLRHWVFPQDERWIASAADVFEKGQYWRLLTALFTHSDAGHLLSNTPLFLIFGWFLYAFFGWVAFPLGSVIIGILSNAATIASYEPDAQLLGASGMLYGMVAQWLVFYICFATEYEWKMRVFRAVGVSLLLLFPTTFEKNVSYMAHATGFLLGGAVAFASLKFVRVRDGAKPPTGGGPSRDRRVGHTSPSSDQLAGNGASVAPDLHPPSRVRVNYWQ